METVDNLSAASTINASCPEAQDFLYLSLNCYPVTLTELLLNCIFFLFGVTNIVLNITAVQAVFQRGETDSVTEIPITSLALTDALCGILLIYQSVYNVVNWHIFHECLFRQGMTIAIVLTSNFHLCFLTFDRYVKITRPYAYPNLFKKRIVFIISAILWISAFGLGLAPLMGWNKQTERQCGFYYIMEKDYELVVVLAFLVPLIVNYILYGHIFQIARKHGLEIVSQTMVTGLNPRPSSQTWKFTKTVFMLLGLRTICFLPMGMFMLLNYFNHVNHMSLTDRALTITYLSLPAYLYSLGNPIIYALKINYIQRHYVTVFGNIPCCCCIRRA